MKQLIRANGIDIHYRIDGPEDGPVVMFSNSLMSNLSMWEGQVQRFSKTYRILRYDQRGHGSTQTTPGPYSIELLTEDARCLLDALSIDKIHFVGLSMGGFTGQLFAHKYPERISSLVLCDTACVMPPHSLWDERIAVALTKGIIGLTPSTLERWFTLQFHSSKTDQLEKVREMILGTGVEGYVGCAQAI